MHPGRPSSTARLIARCTLLAAHDARRRRLVPVGASEALVRMLAAAGRSFWFDPALTRPWRRALLFRLEQAVLPGIILHYLARKQWIERAVVAAIRKGSRHVVVLGAGFDTLAWRLHRTWPEVRFFELDHPATQQFKARALASLAPGPNFTLLPVDFGRELPSSALHRSPAVDPQQRVCFVAEGLLMYFPAERVAELLRDLARKPASAVAFTFMEQDDDGRAAFRGGRAWIDTWLRFRREPFAWAIRPGQLDSFLRSCGGWRVRSLAGAPELRAEILTPAGLADARLAEGEWLCSAS